MQVKQWRLKAVVFAVLCAAPLAGAVQLLVQRQWVWGLVVYWVVSVLAFGFYGYDKKRAMAGEWRTPEQTLQVLALLGGWPGALVAQQVYRHKTRKVGFQVVFWGIVLAHQVFWVDWVVFSGRYLGWGMRVVVAVTS